MDFIEFVKTSQVVLSLIEDFDGAEMLPLLCAFVDVTSLKTGMTSLEVLDYVRPVIEDANKEIGQINARETQLS